MGIDAKMVFKLAGDKPSEDWLRITSFNLCAAIGAKHFFIQDGLLPAEFEEKQKAWHAAWKAHPVTKELEALPKSSYGSNWHLGYPGQPGKNYRDMIVADIGEFDFKERRWALGLVSGDGGDEEGKTYRQDGEPMVVGDGEWLIDVSLWTRYYGVGYERGDLLTICAVAEWAEANIMNLVAVYYGGDSSGVEAEPFDADIRNELRRHYYSAKGREYFKHGPLNNRVGPAPCSLCKPSGIDMSNFGGGGNIEFVHCAGCGKSFGGNDNIGWTIREDRS